MKILLIATFILGSFYSISQENSGGKSSSLSDSFSPETTSARTAPSTNNPNGIAVLSKQLIGSDFQYTFISNRAFDETLKDRWEYRFPISFDYIIDFSMDVSTQQVTITLPPDHTSDELLKLIKRFSYLDYQID